MKVTQTLDLVWEVPDGTNLEDLYLYNDIDTLKLCTEVAAPVESKCISLETMYIEECEDVSEDDAP